MARWKVESLAERFWPKVDKEPGCWIWRGSVSDKGYGHIRGEDGSLRAAHRVAYELTIGPIPEGLVIDHLCRVRNCVNPDHLEPVTIRENILRGVSPTARNAARTHCKNGHPLVPGNLYPLPMSRGTCRRCAIDRAGARRRRLAGQT